MGLQILSFDAFVSRLAAELDLRPDAPLGVDTAIVEDLGFDSFMLVEALAVIEEMDSLIDDNAMGTASTLGDLYHLYAVGRVDTEASVVIVNT